MTVMQYSQKNKAALTAFTQIQVKFLPFILTVADAQEQVARL